MDFGQILKGLSRGDKFVRTGWNGKDMFIYLVAGSTFICNQPPLLGIYPSGTVIHYQPHIDMKTIDGSCVPWVASQTDILAYDWELVEEVQTAKEDPPVDAEPITDDDDVDPEIPPEPVSRDR